MDWNFLLAALGLAMVLEGAAYFLFAERMPSMLALLAQQGPRLLRGMGLAAMLLGLALLYWGRS
ncbi:MAG: DUF2065 domain-containing protein [Desulfovibrionaceae bacterium]